MQGALALAVLRLTLRPELGLEWDSNANRAEVVANQPSDTPTSSFLLRTTARGTLLFREGRNVLRAVLGVGGKVFFEPKVSDQDVLVAQASLEHRVRARDWLELGGALDYYDAWQLPASPPPCCLRHRDFRFGTAFARAALVDEHGELALGGGWRGFQYKPDPGFDFNAGAAYVSALARFRAGPETKPSELDVSATYHVERRFFSGERLVSHCDPDRITPDCLGAGGASREDWYHTAQLELTFLREVLVSVGYAVQLNRSNSFGQSLLRHVVDAKLSFRLPWQLYVTLKGQLFVVRYLDPVLLNQAVNTQTFVNIEDENRNAVIADVERSIRKLGLSVSARYSFYTNELGTTKVSYSRHVVYLGLSYQYGRSR